MRLLTLKVFFQLQFFLIHNVSPYRLVLRLFLEHASNITSDPCHFPGGITKTIVLCEKSQNDLPTADIAAGNAVHGNDGLGLDDFLQVMGKKRIARHDGIADDFQIFGIAAQVQWMHL